MRADFVGSALLRVIRDDETLTSKPVILVTTAAGEEPTVDGLLASADDYVVEPSTRASSAACQAQVEGGAPTARERSRRPRPRERRDGTSSTRWPPTAAKGVFELKRCVCRPTAPVMRVERMRECRFSSYSGLFGPAGFRLATEMSRHAYRPLDLPA
jgi:CheY-like chemotaxis protein